jgi:hypothetical protein
MLAQARKRSDIEWILGDLSSVRFEGEFDLVVMTGHAFQVLIEDDDLRASLAAVRAALSADGRFAFETRNPLVCGWRRWNEEYTRDVSDVSGAVVRMQTQVEAAEGELVSFRHTFTSPRWSEPKQSTSTLRFLPKDTLTAFLSGADLAVDEQYGDWNGEPLIDTSPEIITVARRGFGRPPGANPAENP